MDFETIIGELTAEIHRLNDLLAAERAQNEALLEQVILFLRKSPGNEEDRSEAKSDASWIDSWIARMIS